MLTSHTSCFILLLFVSPILVKGDATSALAAVQEAFFRWNVKEAPWLGTQAGYRQYNDRLKNLSLGVFDEQLDAVQQFIHTALTIDRGQLSRQHQYSYDIFMDTLNTFVSNYKWRHHGALNPINILEGFYNKVDDLLRMTPFDTKEDFDNYLSRLQAWPNQINQMMVRMDKAIQMRTTFANITVEGVPEQIFRFINRSVQDSVLYRPFTDTVDSLQLSREDVGSLRSRAVTAVENLFEALRQLKSYFEDTYIPNTRDTYGLYGLPNGKDLYRDCLKWHLSVDMSPEEVHQTGLREVDRITQLMKKVMTKHGFNGTVGEYYSQLNADPQFGMNSAEEILQGYRDLINKRINPKIHLLFKDVPFTQIEVRPSPNDGPARYIPGSADGSRPGIFYANVFRLNDTKSYTMAVLTMHEAAPGHQLQYAFQLNAGVPNFQKHQIRDYYYHIPYKFPLYSAYRQGWALYGEFLGEEMGVYENDYELMGRYGKEMFRACRLVVDTGLHYYGWSPEKAIKFMYDRTPASLPKIKLEIRRYLIWPGHSCSYKIGEIKIKELRQKTARALGSKFDIHEFHSVVLGSGTLPLRVLETIVNDYIQDHQKNTPSGMDSYSHSSTASGSGLLIFLASLVIALTHP